MVTYSSKAAVSAAAAGRCTGAFRPKVPPRRFRRAALRSRYVPLALRVFAVVVGAASHRPGARRGPPARYRPFPRRRGTSANRNTGAVCIGPIDCINNLLAMLWLLWPKATIISASVCVRMYVCRGMLVTTQSKLVANYLTSTTTPQLENGRKLYWGFHICTAQTNQKMCRSRTMMNDIDSLNLSFLTNL